jgi:hypothetical protein
VSALADALIAFLLLSAIFLPLERLFAAHEQRVVREQWLTDLAFFAGQYLLWTRRSSRRSCSCSSTSTACRSRRARARALAADGRAVRLGDRAQRPVDLLGASLVALERVPVALPSRAPHAPRLDWLAAHREHPFDNLYTRLIENLPLIVLGFPLATLAGFATFRGLWALYIHSNVRLMPGPLRFVLGAPRLHHWHHDLESGGRVNFANLSPLMDLAFGTYHDPGHFPERYGLTEPHARSYLGHMFEPLLAGRVRRAFEQLRFGRAFRKRALDSARANRGLRAEAVMNGRSIVCSILVLTCVASSASAQTTQLVSSNAAGTIGNDRSEIPSVSGDGHFAAFVSGSTNLVPGDTNNWDDLFVKDLQSGAITRLSVGPGGVEADFLTDDAQISADGRFVAFHSGATNLVASDLKLGARRFRLRSRHGERTRSRA